MDRDESGVLHIVALSGGHDSTAMSFLLKEREPRPYNYVCTPTGDELPEMWAFWQWLGTDNALGKRILPIMRMTLRRGGTLGQWASKNLARFSLKAGNPSPALSGCSASGWPLAVAASVQCEGISMIRLAYFATLSATVLVVILSAVLRFNEGGL